MTKQAVLVWAVISAALTAFVWVVGRSTQAGSLTGSTLAIYLIAGRKQARPWHVRLLWTVGLTAGTWLSSAILQHFRSANYRT